MRAQKAGKQKDEDLKENLILLDQVLARADELAGRHPGGYLFGDKLTTGDVFFLPILRIFTFPEVHCIQNIESRMSCFNGHYDNQKHHGGVHPRAHKAWHHNFNDLTGDRYSN